MAAERPDDQYDAWEVTKVVPIPNKRSVLVNVATLFDQAEAQKLQDAVRLVGNVTPRKIGVIILGDRAYHETSKETVAPSALMCDTAEEGAALFQHIVTNNEVVTGYYSRDRRNGYNKPVMVPVSRIELTPAELELAAQYTPPPERIW